MPKALTKSKYQALISQISGIYTQAQTRSKQAVNQIVIEAYWQIGKRIVEVEQGNKLRADYGEELLKRLSGDLLETLGSGFSGTNLRYMRQFYLTYPIYHARDKLQWTHYRSLLTVKDAKLRRYYEKQISENSWSTRDLEQYLKLDKVDRQKLGQVRIPALGVVKFKEDKLPIVRGQLNVYSLVAPPSVSEFKHPLLIDCGFEMYCDVSLGTLKHPTIGEFVESFKTSSGFAFKKSTADKDKLYTYKAIVERIVDGDTLLCWMDGGLNNWIRQRLRLRSIDAPEIKTQRGVKAKTFVTNLLLRCKYVVVKTYKTDKYDRYLADIFYIPDEEDINLIASSGRLLNQDLIDARLAVHVN